MKVICNGVSDECKMGKCDHKEPHNEKDDCATELESCSGAIGSTSIYSAKVKCIPVENKEEELKSCGWCNSPAQFECRTNKSVRCSNSVCSLAKFSMSINEWQKRS